MRIYEVYIAISFMVIGMILKVVFWLFEKGWCSCYLNEAVVEARREAVLRLGPRIGRVEDAVGWLWVGS